jgi:hypothetical protein
MELLADRDPKEARTRLDPVLEQMMEAVQSREHLATATTMYRDMDMGFWLGQAEAEMRELA